MLKLSLIPAFLFIFFSSEIIWKCHFGSFCCIWNLKFCAPLEFKNIFQIPMFLPPLFFFSLCLSFFPFLFFPQILVNFSLCFTKECCRIQRINAITYSRLPRIIWNVITIFRNYRVGGNQIIFKSNNYCYSGADGSFFFLSF